MRRPGTTKQPVATTWGLALILGAPVLLLAGLGVFALRQDAAATAERRAQALGRVLRLARDRLLLALEAEGEALLATLPRKGIAPGGGRGGRGGPEPTPRALRDHFGPREDVVVAIGGWVAFPPRSVPPQSVRGGAAPPVTDPTDEGSTPADPRLGQARLLESQGALRAALALYRDVAASQARPAERGAAWVSALRCLRGLGETARLAPSARALLRELPRTPGPGGAPYALLGATLALRALIEGAETPDAPSDTTSADGSAVLDTSSWLLAETLDAVASGRVRAPSAARAFYVPSLRDQVVKRLLMLSAALRPRSRADRAIETALQRALLRFDHQAGWDRAIQRTVALVAGGRLGLGLRHDADGWMLHTPWLRPPETTYDPPLVIQVGRGVAPPGLLRVVEAIADDQGVALGWLSPTGLRGGADVAIADPDAQILDLSSRLGGGSLAATDLTDGALASAEARRRRLALGIFAVALLAVGIGAIYTARALRREAAIAAERAAFVANVTHQLRTPIAAITLHAELLQLKQPTKRAAVILGEAVRLTHLVENVLAASRLEKGWADAPPRPIDLSALVNDVAEALRPLIEASGSSLRVAIDDEVLVSGHREALRQAALNLIDNAMRHGEEEVVVSVIQRNDRAEFSVSDRGPGVAAEDHKRIFDRFHRGAAARESGGASSAGTGLGLAVVAEIAALHGGTITLDRAHCGGARFVLSLPCGGL